ncbi:hypothetical protein [Alicyclobacillus fastidiosus]|uniref:Uncharacterized protein n=1 Tax=Alicyclobacillus fastidiosus TaxID=392011 RepID=A0ABV5AK29_9BACL|nr:hypothetical protein [Alicyclobacillus fastidiosus]WEH10992.1 hypothetical protein PYS47_07180 [Alicyclobacillus fastidiosus]
MKMPFKAPSEVPQGLDSYVEACHKAAKLLNEAGVPKDEIPEKLTQAVKLVMEWIV